MSRYSNSGTKENHAKLSFWSKQSIRHSIHIRTAIVFSTFLNWFKTSFWFVRAEKPVQYTRSLPNSARKESNVCTKAEK